MTAASLRIVPSADLTPAEWTMLTSLCVAAFDEPWGTYWDDIGPGLHVLAQDQDGGISGHAAIVDRLLYPGEATLHTGYVEAVAVWPDRQGSGIGTQVMETINRLIDERYELGGLGTGRHAFYGRQGWEVWQGPTWIRNREGVLERSAAEDGDIMVRITPATPAGLDLALPIAVDWRPGEVW